MDSSMLCESSGTSGPEANFGTLRSDSVSTLSPTSASCRESEHNFRKRITLHPALRSEPLLRFWMIIDRMKG